MNNIGDESLQITNNLSYQSNINPYSNMNKKSNGTAVTTNNTINIENCSSKDLTDDAKKLYQDGKITDEDYSLMCIRAQLATIRINHDGSTTHLADTNRNWVSVFKQDTACSKVDGASQSQLSEDARLQNIIDGL